MALFHKGVAPLNSYMLTVIVNYGSSNEEVFEIPKANLVRFTHKRNATNKGNTFSLTLLGALSLTLEYKMLSGNKKVKISYGSSQQSMRTFVGEILGSDIKFEDMAIAFEVNGVVSVFSDDKTPRSVTYKKGTTLKSIISDMCKRHGWTLGHVEEAQPLEEDVVQSSMSDTDFLAKVLSSKLTTLTGVVGYSLWFTYDGDKIIINYTPLACKGSNESSNKTYVLYGGEGTPLLNWEVENSGSLAFSCGTQIAKSKIDEATGKIITEYSKKFDASMAKIIGDEKNLLGKRDIFNNKTKRKVQESYNDNYFKAYYAMLNSITYNATGKVLGDVYMDAGQMINVEVYLEDGMLHYSSGEYRVSEVTDEITTDGFTTSFDCVKFTSGIGSEVTL